MKRVLLSLLAVAIAIAFTSCSKQEPQIDTNNTVDPEGAIEGEFKNDHEWYFAFNDGYYSERVWFDSGNLGVGFYPYDELGNAKEQNEQVVYLGEGNCLGNINTNIVPSSGWAKQCVAVVGGLYILRFKRESYFDSSVQYYGFYVAGLKSSYYTVKFCPFIPGQGWTKFSSDN